MGLQLMGQERCCAWQGYSHAGGAIPPISFAAAGYFTGFLPGYPVTAPPYLRVLPFATKPVQKFGGMKVYTAVPQ